MSAREEFEAAIFTNPTDEQAFRVFADWLTEQGDPRGKLITLHQDGDTRRAEDHLEEHKEALLGPLLPHRQVQDPGWNNARSHLRPIAEEKAWQKTQRKAFLWRNGYIHRVRLSNDIYAEDNGDPILAPVAEILDLVLAHPSGRYAVEFAFQSNGDPNEDDLQTIIDVLSERAPKTTRRITFGDNVDQISWHQTGNLSRLWARVRQLRTFEIESGHFEVGEMRAPNLSRAVFITGGLTHSCARDIARAQIPNIEHLEIYYGTPDYGGSASLADVAPLLARTDLPRLKTLGLENAMFTNEIAAALGDAPVLKTLTTLNLSQGTLTDEGARSLVEHKASLAHLRTLDLSSSFLTSEGVELVSGLCPEVLVDDQREPWDWAEEPIYYVSISE